MKHFPIILLILINLACNDQSDKKFNLDFEQFDANKNNAEGWFKWSDYETATVKESHSGNYAGKIISDGKGMEGRIAYAVPANYDGQTIEFEGYMKIKNVTGFAGLLMRMDGKKSWDVNGKKIKKSGFMLGFENMQDQKIKGTKDWQKYTISLPYPEGVEVIYIGGILLGQGEAWFDDFVLKIDGKDIQTLKESGDAVFKAKLDSEFDLGSNIEFPEVDEELVNNLDLLGKIWGFLKYYHPEVGKGNYNWDYELFRILPKYMAVQSVRQRDEVLMEWIYSYGKMEKCESCKTTSPDAILKPDFSWIQNGDLSEALKKQLTDIYQNRHQGPHFYVKITENIKNPEFLNENQYPLMPYPDKGFRLLALYKYWNIINYFFPYKHLTDTDWSKVMQKYVPEFLNAKNELEYELAAIQLIGEVNDTHANLWGGSNKINDKRGKFYASFRVRFVEDALVVTDYFNPETLPLFQPGIGDIITHIDGKPVRRIVDSIKGYYPASNAAARMRDIATDLLRSKKDTISIDYISEGIQKRKNLQMREKQKLNFTEYYRNDGSKSFKLLDGNIGYITLRSLKREEIDSVMALFKDSKGIVIDIRNYPNTFVPFTLGSYFISSATPFVKFTKGSTDNPGEFVFMKPLEIPPVTEMYKGKLVVLVNELSQSQAEYTTMAFQAGENTTVIGSMTAGADGNVSSIYLPGGLSTSISGIGVYYPDGTETQRVGIVPDIEVKPTIEGIKNGKDEVLEKAIEIINE